MSMNWISKIQEKQDTLYPNCDKKNNHILVSKGLQIPYTQNPWSGLNIKKKFPNNENWCLVIKKSHFISYKELNQMTRENVINNKNYRQKKKYMHNKINKLPIRTKPKNKK